MNNKLISFNVPPYIGTEQEYIIDAINSHKICGDGKYTQKCSLLLEKITGSTKVMLTTSCTHATEMAALLADIKEGDEVIMPSYTFVSTANAFVLRGAKCIFVDIRPDTMNLDESKIEDAITSRTKAIVPVHYAGVACEMDTILQIAKKYKLCVIEDAAQGVMSKYKGKSLGTLGDYGCYSFHETKNYSMGEGGALLIKDKDMTDKAEIIREKGTNRNKFYRGEIDKYTWVNIGSSYLPSELNAAYLYGQLKDAKLILDNRMMSWNYYKQSLRELADRKEIELPHIPKECEHNAHMFYIKCKNLEIRTKLILFLRNMGIDAVFHYVPLHSSPAGKKFGTFHGKDEYTTAESKRLLRLPLYYGVKQSDLKKVVDAVYLFYER